MGTVTLYEDEMATTVGDDIDYQFCGGVCCILILLMIIFVLYVSNKKLKIEKKNKTRLVEKMEHLLDSPHEE